MKLKLFGLSSVAVLLMTSSLVDAKTLSSNEAWQVKRVNAEMPYCTLSRVYDGNVNLTIAKNENDEGTLAFDFGRPAFNANRPYPVTFQVNGLTRRYKITPASESFIVLRLGQDQVLYNAIRMAQTMDVQIDNENFTIGLSGTDKQFGNLDSCIGKKTPVLVEAKTAVPPKAVVQKQTQISQQNNQINQLLEENRRLTSLLSENSKRVPVVIPQTIQKSEDSQQKIVALQSELNTLQARNTNLMAQISKMESDLLESRQNINPDLSGILAEKNQQVELLIQQNKSLENALRIAESKPVEIREVVKEIVKEVPVYSDGANENNAGTSMQLAEAETLAKTYQAERDEYRRLLQIERKRFREMGDVAGQVKDATNKESSLIADVRRLEQEKVELVRQLEFAKQTGQVVEVVTPQAESNELKTLSRQLADARRALSEAESEKSQLKRRMSVIDSEVQRVQSQMAKKSVGSTIAKLADDRPEVIREELEAKTLRSEIAALEAQNSMLKADIGMQKQKRVETNMPSGPVDVVEAIEMAEIKTNENHLSRPLDREQRVQSLRQRLQDVGSNKSIAPMPTAIVNNVQQKNVTNIPNAPIQTQMIALSGDEIRQLVSQSKIPLESSVDRIDRVSGPDFAAFRWDTGIVYGSGEQSRLSDVSAFNNSVQQYIQKTASRCQGSFDQNIAAVNTSNGLTVKSADIACVDDNAMGSAASILFFVRDGMFYALAHEANMDSFKIAMDMRDRLAGSIDQIF